MVSAKTSEVSFVKGVEASVLRIVVQENMKGSTIRKIKKLGRIFGITEYIV
jgi:hypothetical protein